ncbi:hypothetical protein OH76DRAFT_784204 [Lentinus brumalis]|uniref:Uncharacterized protein n=1 Tax=Lentinus brumalis TaxID=2498619 RepID=A0A371D3Z3_9APHY|nr:hypothetical protein OH76DRAFT_784204 [Polyporus brumalis]
MLATGRLAFLPLNSVDWSCPRCEPSKKVLDMSLRRLDHYCRPQIAAPPYFRGAFGVRAERAMARRSRSGARHTGIRCPRHTSRSCGFFGRLGITIDRQPAGTSANGENISPAHKVIRKISLTMMHHLERATILQPGNIGFSTTEGSAQCSQSSLFACTARLFRGSASVCNSAEHPRSTQLQDPVLML